MTANSIEFYTITHPGRSWRIHALLAWSVVFYWVGNWCSAQSFLVLHEFSRVNVVNYGARSALAIADDGFLYGTTFETADSSLGKIYRISMDGDYSIVKSFTNELEGAFPRWLLADGDTLYGVSAQGGNTSHGTVFKLSTSGEGYTVIKRFNGNDGSAPFCLVRDGTVLYGATVYGGSSNQGTLFKLHTDGSGYQVLKEFYGTNGANPWGLTISDHLLYGTTGSGGDYDRGTIFSLETNGSNFRLLRSMVDETDGDGPRGPLVVKDGIIFGVNENGGPGGGAGIVFRMTTNGNDFRILKAFERMTEGYHPDAGLVLSGKTLYGVTSRGTNQLARGGTVFQISVEGTEYTILHRFNVTNGIMPFASLSIVGTDLFGTTELGGGQGHGTIFRLSVAPPEMLVPPQSQTVEEGSPMRFAPRVTGSRPMTFEWHHNGTNLVSSSTNSTYQVRACEGSMSGSYMLSITNLFGCLTSSPVMLNVIPPVARRLVPAIQLVGEEGVEAILESSEAISAGNPWLVLDRVTLSASLKTWCDPADPVPARRFYRVSQTNTPMIPAQLQLHYAPELTLRGSIGSAVRVDGINQFGPTDAWFTIDTVTLTNPAQRYFDTTAIGGLPRLHRITTIP